MAALALIRPSTTATRLATLAPSSMASAVARRGSSEVAWLLVVTASSRPIRAQTMATHVSAVATQNAIGTACHGRNRAATTPATTPGPAAEASTMRVGRGW